MVRSMYEYRKQPWKFLFFATQMPLLFVKIPLWLVFYSLPFFRPSPSWPYTRAVTVKILRTLYVWSYSVGTVRRLPTFRSLQEDDKGVKSVWIEPVPELLYGEVKEAAQTNEVSCIRIPGYWLDKVGSEEVKAGAPPVPGEKVLLCLHGGGYVGSSAHPSDYTSNIPRKLLKHCHSVTRAFSVEYRLCRASPYPPSGAFPSALLDALAGYIHLIQVVGFDPNDIILEGDSAGGHIALSLVRYLVEGANHLSLPPPPSALILCSPLTDIGASHRESEISRRNLKLDYINFAPVRLDYLRRGFTGSLSWDSQETSRWFSPGSKSQELEGVSFKGYPKTLIVAGADELIKASIIHLRDRMRRDLDEKHVAYIEAPNSVHDFIIMSISEPERTEALEEISKWVSLLD